MGSCKIECPEGKAECCIHCERQEGCDNRCDMMDSYEYVEECENYETEGGNACVEEITGGE